jgi:hypothetical protein
MIRPISCTLIILGLASIVQGETTFLNPSQSVQAAIDQASPGDTIVLGPGTYRETIDFQGKAITITSSDGPETTVLDGSDFVDTSVVTLRNGEGAGSVLEQVTVTGGTGTFTGATRKGGGIFMSFASPVVRDCIITANSAPIGGGIFLQGGAPSFTGCQITENEAGIEGGLGGGGLMASGGSAKMVRCSFVNNDTHNGQGGAIYFFGGNHQAINSLFRGNNAFVGGAISSTQAIMLIANCTMVGNSSVPGGGSAIADVSAFSWIHNSILWDNGTANGAAPLYVSTTTNSTVQNCNIMGGWPGNMNEQPSFLDAANDNYQLTADSPCVNMGEISDVPMQGQEQDLNTQPRVVDDAVDLGAYEFQDDTQEPDPCSSDVTDDGLVDVRDLVSLILAWGACDACPEDFDGNGLVDVDDLGEMLLAWGPCP